MWSEPVCEMCHLPPFFPPSLLHFLSFLSLARVTVESERAKVAGSVGEVREGVTWTENSRKAGREREKG